MGQANKNRRAFLKRAAKYSAVVAAPYFVPGTALGLNGAVPPSDRIVMGSIGTGGKGRHNTQTFMKFPDVQYVAVCDVDADHLQTAQEMVNSHYKNKDCKAYRDFRDLVARKDIQAVCVSTPDHWHALATIAAAENGKDIYCEKPLANSVAEGRAMCDAVYGNKRILQTGSHERSGANARFACELVRNGRIGKLHTIVINLPCDDKHHLEARKITEIKAQPVPKKLDYDFWLGHTDKVPYHEKRCHFWWRFNLAYGGGEMTDRGAHVIDIAQLGAGFDDSGPVEYQALGKQQKGLYSVFWDYLFINIYPNGVKMIGSTKGPRGVKFEGTEGWIFVHIHGQKLEASKPQLLRETLSDSELRLGRSPGHHRNFIDCVKSRIQPVASAEIGHRTGSICHLNNIAMLTGKRLLWDPKDERITNDSSANALLEPKMRQPWHL